MYNGAMSDESKKSPFWSGILIKMWETFIEKLLVPILMAVVVGAFGVWQQKASEKTVDTVYQKVAQTINKDLPANLETLRKQVNEQGETLDQTRKAVLELSLRHAVEDELRRASRVRVSRTRTVGQPPPASQPAPALEKLKHREPHKAMAPLRKLNVPAQIKF